MEEEGLEAYGGVQNDGSELTTSRRNAAGPSFFFAPFSVKTNFPESMLTL